jgi:hypothetical protein
VASVEVASAGRGFQRFTLDMPLEDHCRFKALCAMKQTTMRAEIQSLVAAQISAPNIVLSEFLTQFEAAARARFHSRNC